MSLYSFQKVFCQICGKEMKVKIADAQWDNGRVCSSTCWREWDWRRSLSTVGKPYYPQEPVK